jgi:hypothetical protein
LRSTNSPTQRVCDELLRKLETALNALHSSTTKLTNDMPNKIAQQAAKEVVQRIADLVARRVEEVLRPAEGRAQALLSEMKEAAATYRREARHAVTTCIIFGSLSGAVSGVLVVLAIMKMAGIV